MLIEHNARVDVKDHNGDEPVHAAAKSKDCMSVCVLKEAGADMCALGNKKLTMSLRDLENIIPSI